MGSHIHIRDDLHARRLVDEYRSRFAEAPVGKWQTNNDLFMGLGFEGVVGFGSRLEFNTDRHGLLYQGGSEPILARFQWRTAGTRTVQIRILECSEDSREYLDDSDYEWDTIEYDFFVTSVENTVYLHESRRRSADPFLRGFWFSANPLAYVSGPIEVTERLKH